MTIEEVLKIVNDVFIDVLDDRGIKIEMTTTSQDIDDWDSLNHIMLIVGIEKAFEIKFTTEEVHEYKNVGEMCLAIQRKIKDGF